MIFDSNVSTNTILAFSIFFFVVLVVCRLLLSTTWTNYTVTDLPYILLLGTLLRGVNVCVHFIHIWNKFAWRRQIHSHRNSGHQWVCISMLVCVCVYVCDRERQREHAIRSNSCAHNFDTFRCFGLRLLLLLLQAAVISFNS